MTAKLFILIPVLNEAWNIPRLIDTLRNLCAELQNRFTVRVFLIDDGSRDNTAESAKTAADKNGINLVVLRHDTNQGPGKAFGTGFGCLREILHDDDLILTMEGDNTSRLELVRQMLMRLNEGYDAVYASPYMYGGEILNTSPYRVFLSAVANLLIKELLGISGIFTTSSFFRLYRATSIKRLQAVYGSEILERNGFECMVEMTIKMINLRISISEVPMVLNTKWRIGKSQMKVTRTIVGYLSLWSSRKKWKTLAGRQILKNE